jgi:ABC-type amino acid transport substrate-binding protein
VFISRQEDNIEQPEDLNGRTVLLSRATIFEDVVEAMAGEYQLDIRRYYVEPSEEFARLVYENQVDAAPNDSLYAILALSRYEGLKPYPWPPVKSSNWHGAWKRTTTP